MTAPVDPPVADPTVTDPPAVVPVVDPPVDPPVDPKGFDGPYDETRARKTIDTLREENREALRQLKEFQAAAKVDPPVVVDPPKEPALESEALAEIRAMRHELAEEKALAKFTLFATTVGGMRPEAANLAFGSVREELQIADNGAIVNLSSVIDTLKATNEFMFVPLTNGQQQHGSSGGGGTGNGAALKGTDDEIKFAKMFGQTIEQYNSAKTGTEPKKS